MTGPQSADQSRITIAGRTPVSTPSHPSSKERLTVISLGAGKQSSWLVMMAARGEVAEMPDAAIFSDTQREPKAVYRHLDWLENQLPFPVYRVTAGDLGEQILLAVKGEARMDARPPFFTLPDGMLNRQCTQDFKIIPIIKKIRELLGLKPRERAPKEPVVEQWIGISIDEAVRMKPSRLPYITHRWPLVEHHLTREQCDDLLWKNYGRRAPKSACTFCPYHDDALWRDMQLNDPVSFAEAVEVDRAIRNGIPGSRKPSQWFVHASRKPLEQVDFRSAEEAGQFRLFGNECEGMCGV